MKTVLLFFFMHLMATEKSSGQSKPIGNPPQTRKQSALDKIVFITLKIKKVMDTINVTLSDTRIVDGKAKLPVPNSSVLQEGDLLCFITDIKHTKTDTIVINQPLNRRYEYPGDNGVIGYTTVSLDETEITLRMPYKSSMKFVQIESAKSNKKAKHIVTLPL